MWRETGKYAILERDTQSESASIFTLLNLCLEEKER